MADLVDHRTSTGSALQGVTMPKHIYKVCSAAEWRAASACGQYFGSPDDRRDGFIHLSTAPQLPGTLARHFAGRTELVLIAFEPGKFGDTLKWEAARGGALFPHVYGPLATSLALSVEPLPLDVNRQFKLRADLT